MPSGLGNWRARVRTGRLPATRELTRAVVGGLYLGGFGSHGDREHSVVDVADVERSLVRLVDALGGRSTDRSYGINRVWLDMLRAMVPTPPSRRWTALTLKRRIGGVPVPDDVREAVVDAIH